MAIAEPSPSTAPSPKQLGRQLRQVRKQKGLSRSEVARSAGLTRRELAAYERGKVAVPESDLWCLAGSCGVDVNELLPNRDPLRITSDLSSLTVGNSIRHLRATQERDGVLREYLSMIYELRNLPPGSRVPLRETDLATLADALGGTPDLIEQRLMELIGASREEAARLRAMILPPLSLPAAGETASADHYASTPQTFDPAAAAEQFFSTPRAEDPFAKPPADDTLAPAPHIDAFFGAAPTSDPFSPTDPFAMLDADDPFGSLSTTPNPFADATDLFAPPSGEPLSTAPPEADPFAMLPTDAGAMPDLAELNEILNPFADLPEGMQIDDPLGTRGFAPDVRSSFAETPLTMDPFGAAFEASVTPLEPADLLRRPDAGDDTVAETTTEAESTDEAAPEAAATGWVEVEEHPHAEAEADAMVVDAPVDEVAGEMVEAMVDPTAEPEADEPGADEPGADEPEADESVTAFDAVDTPEAFTAFDGSFDGAPADARYEPAYEEAYEDEFGGDAGTTYDTPSSFDSPLESPLARAFGTLFGTGTTPPSPAPEAGPEVVADEVVEDRTDDTVADAAGEYLHDTHDPFGFAPAAGTSDPNGYDHATESTDPFGFTAPVAEGPTSIDPDAAFGENPFGFDMPSIEDLLNSASALPGADAFPAGDGWRESPTDDGAGNWSEASTSAPSWVDTPARAWDAPATPSWDETPATGWGEAPDETVADENAPAEGWMEPPAAERQPHPEPHPEQAYGEDGWPEGMHVDMPVDMPVDASAPSPGEPTAFDTPEATEEPGILVDHGYDVLEDRGIVVDTGYDEPLAQGFEAPATPVFSESGYVAADTDPVTAVPPTVERAPIDDDDLVPIAWTAHAPRAVLEIEAAPEPVLEFVTAGPDWQVGGIYPATAGADGTLSMRRADVRWALADITAGADCTIEAVVDFTSGAGFGVLFRASLDDTERLTAYSFDVEPAYSGGSYLVRQWVDNQQHWQPLAQAPVVDPAMLYGERTLRLTLAGGELTVQVDDQVVLHIDELEQTSFDLGHEPCRGDRIGVQAGSTTEVTVDTLRVAHH